MKPIYNTTNMQKSYANKGVALVTAAAIGLSAMGTTTSANAGWAETFFAKQSGTYTQTFNKPVLKWKSVKTKSGKYRAVRRANPVDYTKRGPNNIACWKKYKGGAICKRKGWYVANIPSSLDVKNGRFVSKYDSQEVGLGISVGRWTHQKDLGWHPLKHCRNYLVGTVDLIWRSPGGPGSDSPGSGGLGGPSSPDAGDASAPSPSPSSPDPGPGESPNGDVGGPNGPDVGDSSQGGPSGEIGFLDKKFLPERKPNANIMRASVDIGSIVTNAAFVGATTGGAFDRTVDHGALVKTSVDSNIDALAHEAMESIMLEPVQAQGGVASILSKYA